MDIIVFLINILLALGAGYFIYWVFLQFTAPVVLAVIVGVIVGVLVFAANLAGQIIA